MSLLFQKRLKNAKANDTKKLNVSKANMSMSLPHISSKRYNLKLKKNNKLKSLNEFMHKEENLVKAINLNDTKTRIPFVQINNNSNGGVTDNKIEKKRKEKLAQWELNEVDLKISNCACSNINVNHEKMKELKERKYLQKLQVFEMEKKLINKIKEYENKLKSLKEEKNTICKDIIKYTDRINDYNDNLENIKTENNENQYKLIELEKKNKTNLLEENYLLNNQNSLDIFESKLKQYDNYQEIKNELINKVNNCKEEIVKLKNEQNENKINITNMQKEYNNLKKELLDHYHRILFEGVDTRKEGLSWVIQSIWDIGEEVNLNYMPKFLDIHAINYLFAITKKNINLKRLKLYIEQYKNDSCKTLNLNLNKNQNNKTIYYNDENSLNISSINENNNLLNRNNYLNNDYKKYILFSTCLRNTNNINNNNINKKIIDNKNLSFVGVRDYLKMKKKEEQFKINIKKIKSSSLPNINSNDDKITVKMFLDKRNGKNSIYYNNENSISLTARREQDKYMEKYNQLKLMKNCLEKDIEKTKNKEIKRIFDEFIGNDYGKKFNVDIKIVISALVGENNMFKEMEKQKFISNELIKIKKRYAFYDTYENGKFTIIHKNNNNEKSHIS